MCGHTQASDCNSSYVTRRVAFGVEAPNYVMDLHLRFTRSASCFVSPVPGSRLSALEAAAPMLVFTARRGDTRALDHMLSPDDDKACAHEVRILCWGTAARTHALASLVRVYGCFRPLCSDQAATASGSGMRGCRTSSVSRCFDHSTSQARHKSGKARSVRHVPNQLQCRALAHLLHERGPAVSAS